jgi:Tol biopolymer transport system component
MSIDQRIREGLHRTDAALPTPDVDDALAAVRANGRPAHRGVLVAALAAAAVAAAVAAVIVVPRVLDNDGARPPVAPSPSPTPDLSPTPAPVEHDGSIYFAADHRGGDALEDPLTFEQAEFHQEPRDIYLSRRGEPVRRVIATDAAEGCPRVSPDGDRLAYLEDGTRLVVVPLDADGDPGAPQVQAPLSAPVSSCPEWSPDGERVGYAVVLGDPETPLYSTRPAEVHAVSLDGEDQVLASFDVQIWHQPAFAWAPDSDEVVYTTEGGVWRTPPDDDEAELLWEPAAGDASQELPMAFDRPTTVSWLREDEIAFTAYSSEPDEANNPYGTGSEIYTAYVLDPRSGRARKIDVVGDVGAGTGGAAEWSPDGSRLAFTGPGGQVRLHDLDSDSTTTLGLRVGRRDEFYDLAWSPHGDQLLAMVYDEKKGYALASLPIDGSGGELRTPWTWALDWVVLDDVDWAATD